MGDKANLSCLPQASWPSLGGFVPQPRGAVRHEKRKKAATLRLF